MSNQTGDLSTLLFPLLCCLLALLLTTKNPQPQLIIKDDLWFTTQSITEAYESVRREINKMREEIQRSKQKSRGRILSKRGKNRLIVQQEIPPKLYKIIDDEIGEIYFEFTEVEGGGTVVKATYNTLKAKDLIARCKVEQPTKIPAVPVSGRCPACGKPVLPEFNLCPYCGKRLAREGR